jgi:endonuclease/exonuclease/phosphatase (EEP) superfamily protein YafD
LEATHPHTVKEPLDNTYGMLLYSRLPLTDSEVRHLVEDDVPSVYTKVVLRSGQEVVLHCIHPKPPRPIRGDDTTPRDRELFIVAREVKGSDLPAVVIGDFNDVGWSRTTRRFQEISGLLDPRIGRGMYSTFPAQLPLLRFPLDHVFHANVFRLIELERLGSIGSDHFPILVELSYEPTSAGN